MEGLKEAIDRVAELAVQAEKTEVVMIAGKTYANRNLVRYDTPKKAAAIHTHTLVSLLEYIEKCAGEFAGKKMTIHVESPERVRFISELDSERGRECLFEAEAEISAFRFGSWYEQENFMIALQSNFQPNDDLAAVMMLAGNIEKKNKQTFSDDGVSQVATMSVGVASKADAMVPNPVDLTPFRTFMEVKQPSSKCAEKRPHSSNLWKQKVESGSMRRSPTLKVTFWMDWVKCRRKSENVLWLSDNRKKK